jgi:hypothetical protein
MRGMEGRPEALAGWFNAQNVANMLLAVGPHTVQYRTLVVSTLHKTEDALHVQISLT